MPLGRAANALVLIVPLCIGNSVFFWWFMRSLFEGEFRLDRWAFAALIAVLALGLGRIATGGGRAPLIHNMLVVVRCRQSCRSADAGGRREAGGAGVEGRAAIRLLTHYLLRSAQGLYRYGSGQAYGNHEWDVGDSECASGVSRGLIGLITPTTPISLKAFAPHRRDWRDD
jgi:hypothetical protein